MKEFSISFNEKFKRIDFLVLFCTFSINLLSISVLYGGRDGFDNPKYYLTQLIASVIGIIIAFSMSFLDYDKFISKYEFIILIIAIILMVSVIVLGKGSRGNKSWIKLPGIPFYIQPSEFDKPLFIILIAKQIDRFKLHINKFRNILILLIYASLFFGLNILTKDLGTTLVYIAVFVIMLFTAGVSYWYFIGSLVLLVLSSPLLWKLLSENQKARILVGFNPELDKNLYGYQPLLSKKAIASGGFRGLGIDGGNIYKQLPESHSDFLFSVLAEKFGFIGCFILTILISTLIIRIFLIAKDSRKDYGAEICVGVASILIIQTIENIGMCLAMLPVIGITFPFFSYGGSSIISMYICIGLVQSIKSHNKKYYFERERA